MTRRQQKHRWSARRLYCALMQSPHTRRQVPELSNLTPHAIMCRASLQLSPLSSRSTAVRDLFERSTRPNSSRPPIPPPDGLMRRYVCWETGGRMTRVGRRFNDTFRPREHARVIITSPSVMSLAVSYRLWAGVNSRKKNALEPSSRPTDRGGGRKRRERERGIESMRRSIGDGAASACYLSSRHNHYQRIAFRGPLSLLWLALSVGTGPAACFVLPTSTRVAAAASPLPRVFPASRQSTHRGSSNGGNDSFYGGRRRLYAFARGPEQEEGAAGMGEVETAATGDTADEAEEDRATAIPAPAARHAGSTGARNARAFRAMSALFREKESRAAVTELRASAKDVDSGSESNPAAVRPKKILIIMSDTGGGHRASSQALSAALENLYGDQASDSPLACRRSPNLGKQQRAMRAGLCTFPGGLAERSISAISDGLLEVVNSRACSGNVCTAAASDRRSARVFVSSGDGHTPPACRSSCSCRARVSVCRQPTAFFRVFCCPICVSLGRLVVFR